MTATARPGAETSEALQSNGLCNPREDGPMMRHSVVLRMMKTPLLSRTNQISMVALITHLIAGRFTEAYVPRQLSSLIENAPKDKAEVFPWRSFLVLVAMGSLSSPACRDALTDFAFLPLRQSSWRTLGPQSFMHVMGLSRDFHASKDSTEAVSAIWKGDDLHDLLSFLSFDFPSMVVDAVFALIYIWQSLDWYAALVVATAGTFHLLLSVRMVPCTAEHQKRYNDRFNTHYSTTADVLRNWHLVDCHNGHEHEARRFEAQLRQTQHVEAQFYRSHITTVVCQSLVMTLARNLVSIFAVHRFWRQEMGHGDLVRLIAYVSLIERPFQSTTKLAKKFTQWRANSDLLSRFMRHVPTITDCSEARPLESVLGALEFRKVTFHHKGALPVLYNICFRIPPGSSVAVVGNSGAGKSSMLDLACRLSDPQSGCILIDEQDISKVERKSLKQCVTMVPQRPTFLQMSILDNLLYPGLEAELEMVWSACKKVGLHDKINNMPKGYQTQIFESGSNLSGGELQRLAIARVLLKIWIEGKCKIVLFDEVTSSLDPLCQLEVIKAIRAVNALGVTTVFATHRLETTQHVDTILYLSGGEIVESGTHADLMSRDGGKYKLQWEAAFALDE